MSPIVRARGVAAVVGAATLLALVGGTLTVPAEAAPADPSPCPAAVPLDAVSPGVTGTGYTVVTGSTPQPFQVEVLGVLKDGIGAGRDMIIIKVSDVAGGHVVDQGGGIWAGMSGSPVYVDGQLLGAVSYGFTASPSPIGGLTPAGAMYDVLDRAGAVPLRQKAAKLSAADRKIFAARAKTAAPQGALQELTTPLGVSGLSTRRLTRLQTDTERAGWNVKVYSAGRASAAVGEVAATPVPGGNFAAALSYGDVTAAGIGTTTAVCGNKALAFGHPFQLAGPVNYGANDASSVAIIEDTSFGSFKMANLGATVGTVDQDRLAAIRADLTRAPETARITTIVRSLDTGQRRIGTTDVTDPSLLGTLATYGLFANQDAVFDEWADGTNTSTWSITGTRAGGRPFVLTRTNRFASRGDSTIDPAFDLGRAVSQLVDNEYEQLDITSIGVAAKMSTTFEQQHITSLAVSVNGRAWTSPASLVLRAGDTVRLRVGLAPFRGTTDTSTILSLKVPKSAAGKSGYLSATGGLQAGGSGSSDDLLCLLLGECGGEADGGSLTTLARSIRDAPRNDSVVGELSVSDGDREEGADTTVSTTRLQKLTVTGSREIEVLVRP